MAYRLPDAADADRLATLREKLLQKHHRLTLPNSPLKADELAVLRAQYEKEGPYVGVQTKFNYAWVRDKRPFHLDLC